MLTLPADIDERPHRRWNPLTREWRLVSPHRAKRPWKGQTESVTDDRPAYDPQCYLCPGNTRASGDDNPAYESTYVFKNDFSALLDDVADASATRDDSGLFQIEPVRGECRVICFSPRHDLTLAEMDDAGLVNVINVWAEQVADLGATYRWVQVFENKGAALGCSNPHPHGQVWSGDFLPTEVAKEDDAQRDYLAERGTPLLLDYVRAELKEGSRIVVENADWIALVPFWALWPFETLLLPKEPARHLDALEPARRASLADAMRRLLVRYDNLFECSFPYSMGWHGAPLGPDAADAPHWQLHAHFYPPLLRSATVKKFMVGYEMLGEPQRDLTPEQAADRLRALPETHFKQR